MPSLVRPDRRLPEEWFDSVVYKAATLEELAAKIDVDAVAFVATAARFSRFAATGVDEDFKRGESSFDRFISDPRNTPNPCLGAIETAPFYAIQIDLGDIGTKGGLQTDENANVLRSDGTPITQLYAIGNLAASFTYDSYPGAGATLGPAMTFGIIAAEDIARRARSGTDIGPADVDSQGGRPTLHDEIEPRDGEAQHSSSRRVASTSLDLARTRLDMPR